MCVLDRGKNAMVILMIALAVGIVLSVSLLLMNTANAQVYNGTTEQPQQQKYGAIIVFPLEPEPQIPYNEDTVRLVRDSNGNIIDFVSNFTGTEKR